MMTACKSLNNGNFFEDFLKKRSTYVNLIFKKHYFFFARSSKQKGKIFENF